MKKRLLAMFLCGMMVLTLLPATALAADTTSVWIWGQALTSATPYYHNGENGVQGTVNDNEKNYNAYFDAAAGTLTLNGLNVVNCTAEKELTIGKNSVTFTYAIFADGDLAIDVTANSAVSTGDTAAGNTNIALGVKGDLTFTGTARLDATAGSGDSTVGVYILGDLEVPSGTLSGSTDEAGGATTSDAECFGVSAMATLTVSGGSLIGNGGTATATDNCISAGIGAGAVTVSGGEITATGGAATAAYALSYGLYVTSLDIQGGETQATGNAATGGDTGGFSAGVNVYDVAVSGGSLTAKGGSATVTGTAYSQSCGIYAEADSISFSGGTVKATGGEAMVDSFGILNAGVYDQSEPPRVYESGGAITVSGTADVTATGGGAQVSFGLWCQGTGLTVSAGKLTAGGGSGSEFSDGVCASGDDSLINVTGGTLTAKSEEGATNTFALNKALTCGPGVAGQGSLSSDGSSPVNYLNDDNDTYLWVSVPNTPALVAEPSTSGVYIGRTVTLTATPVNITGPTYQWYSNAVSTTAGAVSIDSATANTYAPPTNTVGTVYYFCQAKGNTTSNIVSVTVTPPPVYDDTDYYRLSFETNGGSTVPTITRTEGSTVDLTSYSATREGYTFDGWHADEALTTAVTSVKLTKDMTVYAGWTAKPVAPDMPFADVPEDAYYRDAVIWAIENGITEGTGDGTTFSPAEACTRAQMAVFLWRAAGSPEPTATVNPFADVKEDAYYYKAVLWAVEQGITLGTGDGATFSPNDTCTRGQMATFLYRYAGSPAMTGSNPFTDVASSDYFYNAVDWAAAEGVTDGTNAAGTTFSPKEECTRGQIVTFLYRFLVK